MKLRFLLAVFALVGTVLIISGCCGAASRSTAKNSAVTYENYQKLETGMSYPQVAAILGEGKLASSSDALGYTSEMYTWDGSSLGSGITLMFSNGVLISKSQMGLESSPKENKGAEANTLPPNDYVPAPSNQVPQAPNEQPNVIPSQTQEPETTPEADKCDQSWYAPDAKFFCKALLYNNSSSCEQVSEQNGRRMQCLAALGACDQLAIDQRKGCRDLALPTETPLCSSGQSYCYESILAAQNPKELCSPYYGEYNRCYFHIAYVKGDSSLCDQIDSYLYYGSARCKAMFGSDPTACFIGSDNNRVNTDAETSDLCVSKIAQTQNNAGICEEYTSSPCYARIAIAKLDETMCDSVGETSSGGFGIHDSIFNWQDECYYKIAIAKGNPSTCEKIKPTYQKNLCLMELALKQKNDGLCSNMVASDTQDECFLKAWFNIAQWS